MKSKILVSFASSAALLMMMLSAPDHHNNTYSFSPSASSTSVPQIIFTYAGTRQDLIANTGVNNPPVAGVTELCGVNGGNTINNGIFYMNVLPKNARGTNTFNYNVYRYPLRGGITATSCTKFTNLWTILTYTPKAFTLPNNTAISATAQDTEADWHIAITGSTLNYNYPGNYNSALVIYGVDDDVDVSSGWGRMFITVTGNTFIGQSGIFLGNKFTPGSVIAIQGNQLSMLSTSWMALNGDGIVGTQSQNNCFGIVVRFKIMSDDVSISIVNNDMPNLACTRNQPTTTADPVLGLASGYKLQNAAVYIGNENPVTVGFNTTINIARNTIAPLTCNNDNCVLQGIFASTHASIEEGRCGHN